MLLLKALHESWTILIRRAFPDNHCQSRPVDLTGWQVQILVSRRMIMSKKLAGKVALVTGGSRGIGAATAHVEPAR